MMPISLRFVIAALAGSMALSPALAERTTVALPAAKAWCSERSIPIDDSSTDADVEDKVDKAKEAGSAELDQQLFKQGIFYSGMPFVAAPRRVAGVATATPAVAPPQPAPTPPPSPPQNYIFDICVLVGAENPAAVPATIKLLALPAANYSVLECGALSADDCVGVLRKEMVESFGSAKEDEIAASPIIEAQAADPVTAASVVAAYRGARSRATWKALSLAASGSTDVNIDDITQRPLAIDEAAGVEVSGMPGKGRKVLMIKEPA